LTDLFQSDQPIKALSLWQPWASLMAAGVKLHETRHWSTSYRGPIAIHAAKRIDVAGAPDELCIAALGRNWERLVPIGMVVAVGRLAACTEAGRVARDLTSADRAAGNFTPGRFAWRVEDVRALKAPVPLTGRQGLFNWTPPADLEELLHPSLDHAATCRRIGWA
jgi:hypothetical protein